MGAPVVRFGKTDFVVWRTATVPVSDESRLRFLALISALEGRMKTLPRYREGVEGQRAEPNWTRFGSEVGPHIQDFVDRRTVELLTVEPPRVEVIRGGVAAFEPASRPLRGGRRPETLGARLVEATVRVRNNLVHGGKERLDQDRYAGHDQALVDAGTAVLALAERWLVRQR